MKIAPPPSFPRLTVIPASHRHSRAGGNPVHADPRFRGDDGEGGGDDVLWNGH